MKRLFLRAEESVENASFLESQLLEVIKEYLAKPDKKCLTGNYKGLPVKLTQSERLVDSNYLVKIFVEEI